MANLFTRLIVTFVESFKPETKPFVTVCAWCPDAHAREFMRDSCHKVPVSHGMCPACVVRQNAEIDKYFALQGGKK